MKRESLYFALANKELARLHALLAESSSSYNSSGTSTATKEWAREQIAKFHEAMNTGHCWIAQSGAESSLKKE